MTLRYSLFILTLILAKLCAGQTLFGSQVDYKKIDSNIFQVRLLVFTDCRDSAFQLDSHGGFYLHPVTSNSRISLSPTLTEVTDIANIIDTASRCDSASKAHGVLKYVYMDTIDFNTTFSGLADSVHFRFEFESNRMLRGTNISGGGTHRNTYNYAYLRKTESAPGGQFSLDPVFLLNNNTPFYLNHLLDLNNGKDSISYRFCQPYTTIGAPTTFTGTYMAYNYPWPAYMPSILNPPYSNPNASTPIGIFLDKRTSLMVSTPVNTGQYNYVICADIWENTYNGRIKVGEVRKETTFIIDHFSGNYSTKISGPYDYKTCEEKTICFSVDASDPVFVPPPPASADPPDTVTISWDNNLEELGATISYDTLSGASREATFCWTPPAGTASNLPYRITLKVVDQESPVPSVLQRTYSIKVLQNAKGSTSIDSVICGDFKAYTASIEPDSNFQSTASFYKEILNSEGNSILGNRKIHFNSTLATVSVLQTDTIVGDTSGTFILKTIINNSNYCPTAYLDTLVLHPNTPDAEVLLHDNIFCDIDGDSLHLGNHWQRAIWDDTVTTKSIYYDSSSAHIVHVTDSCGNTYRYKPNVYVESSPIERLSDTFMCLGDSIFRMYDDPEPFFAKWHDNSTANSNLLKDTGQYWVQITKRCGRLIDSIYVMDNSPKSTIIGDSSVCNQITYRYKNNNQGSVNFRWGRTNFSNANSLIFKNNEEAYLRTKNTCGTSFDSLQLNFIENPTISLADSVLFCKGKSVKLTPNGNHINSWLWNTGDTTSTLKVSTSGTYIITNSVYCATAIDSIRVIENNVPIPTIVVDSSICDTLFYQALISPSFEYTTTWYKNFNLFKGSTVFSTSLETIELKAENTCGYRTTSVKLHPIKAPTVSISSTKQHLCDFDTITLNANVANLGDLLWSTGDSGQSISISQPGTYYISKQVYCGIFKDSIIIRRINTPTITLPKDTTLCDNDSLILTPIISGTTLSYQWLSGDTTSSILVDISGNYVLVATNQCGYATDSTFVYHLTTPIANLGKDTIVTLPFNLTLNGGSADNYLWSTGNTSATISVSDTGTYWVRLHNQCGLTTDSIHISDTSQPVIGIEEFTKLTKIYPNPNTGLLFIQSDIQTFSLSIIDLHGKLLINKEFKKGLSSISTEDYAPGSYKVVIKSDAGVATYSLMLL